MELRDRAEALMRPQVPTPIPPATNTTGELRRMDRMLANRRWLRGAMCFLAVICFGLSLFEGTIITRSLVLIFSLAGEAAIIGIYRVKAKLHGITSKAGVKSNVSIFHSPSLGKMILEMIVWIIQCPPRPNDKYDDWVAGLDSFLILRFYVLLMYATHVSHTSVFPRAIASIVQIRLNYRFFIRTAFLLENFIVTASVIIIIMMFLAVFYSKAEGTSFADSLYFCMGTASFVGLGDISPTTIAGRAAAVCATLVGVVLLCWIVGAVNQALSLGDAERNLHALFRSNELCGLLPAQAARLIQRAWKLHDAKRKKRMALTRHVAAFLVSQQAIAFREMRRELLYFEVVFLRSTRTFENFLHNYNNSISHHHPHHHGYYSNNSSSSATPATSHLGTPVTTPRSRRPFPMFKEMRGKAGRREGNPTRKSEWEMHASEELQEIQQQQQQQSGVGGKKGENTEKEKGGERERERKGEGLTPLHIPAPQLQLQQQSNMAELEKRLEKLENTLEGLAASAERLQGRLHIGTSISV